MISPENITNILDEKKAENITTITIEGGFVDYMILANASSQRQLSAIADAVVQYAKSEGIVPYVDGDQQAEWIAIDLFDAVIHLFKPEKRLYYNLDKMWAHGAYNSEKSE